jgi:hypothetical protein
MNKHVMVSRKVSAKLLIFSFFMFFAIGSAAECARTASTTPNYCCNDFFDLHNSFVFITSGVNMAAPHTHAPKSSV